MIELKVKATGDTPLEAMAALTAFGLRGLLDQEVADAAYRILRDEGHRVNPAFQDEVSKIAAKGDWTDPPAQEPCETAPTAPAPTAPASTVPASATSAPTTPASATPAPATSAVPTLEAVRAKGIEVVRKLGKDTVAALLKEFGVSGMSDLAEQDRAAFLARLEALEGTGGANA